MEGQVRKMRQHKGKSTDGRSWDQITEHYEVEKSLASRLKSAPKEERMELYSKLYDELMTRVPHHPRLTRTSSESFVRDNVAKQIGVLKRYLIPGCVFLEVGPGDCSLAQEAAKTASHVYAADVSSATAVIKDAPANFELIVFNGTTLPLDSDIVDVAYSNQLMEHLHPDDALDQLQSIYRCLKPGGVYVCATPNRLGGPYDISKYFDRVASGFHLREYSARELARLFRSAGFSEIKCGFIAKGRSLVLHSALVLPYECVLAVLPYSVRHAIGQSRYLRLLLPTLVVARK